MSKSTIIHLEFTEGKRAGEHHYFGSISAIFDSFTRDEIGINKQSIYAFNIESVKPYQNKHCIIRKGGLIRKSGNRKAPVKIIRVV